MTAEVVVSNVHPRYRPAKDRISAYVLRVLKQERKNGAAVSVVFVGSQTIRAINRKFLRRDAVTDVISFPLESGKRLEGEIYVNLDGARRQAREYGVSFPCEVARLVIHGTLHLVGYDDRTLRLARVMREREERHLAFWFSEGRG